MNVILRWLVVILLTLVMGWHPPALAQAVLYPPPPSYTGTSLQGRDFSNQVLQAAEFANARLVKANFENSDLRGAVFSTAVMTDANLHGADLSYGMADLVNFTGADLSDALFVEVILLRSIFTDVNIEGADFTDALLDGVQQQQLCEKAKGVNSKTGVATRDSLGCG